MRCKPDAEGCCKIEKVFWGLFPKSPHAIAAFSKKSGTEKTFIIFQRLVFIESLKTLAGLWTKIHPYSRASGNPSARRARNPIC
ncbi:hypothetical protein [Acidocella sp. MX-AZ02]|uniref:hypothetical protein n=1 Tax=Acidocella sp. MX-AZ02 TaxID=1214225 RepID=UPI00196A0734|nr:hypothetical protein [Acidocella sp. MX-AZ02]